MKHKNSHLAFVLVSLSVSSANAQSTVRVSIDSRGLEGRSFSGTASISDDGRYVAFASLDDDLVPGDTNGKADVFVHDRRTGTTQRVSVSSTGAESDADCMGPFISADGRFVAFRGGATTLVANDTNDVDDVFVYDRQTGTTVRASVATNGAEGTDESYYGSLSADGRFVCFTSEADNFVAGDGNHDYDVFVWDATTGVTECASVGFAGGVGQFFSVDPHISADGRYVAYMSYSPNLVAADTNFAFDVFVFDRTTGLNELVSRNSSGAQGDQGSDLPSLSADGRFVAFTSDATNLVAGDTNGVSDVFVRDRQLGTTERVSVASSGAEGDGTSLVYYAHAAISADGRYVTFESSATNLVPNDTNGVVDVFLRDRLLGTTERISVSSSGAEGDALSFRGTISSDGRVVVFESLASGLVAGDTNATLDVFVRDATVACAPIEAYCEAKTNSAGCAPVVGTSGLPSAAGDDGFFVTGVDFISRTAGVLVWSTSPDSIPFGGGTLCVAAPRVRTATQRSGGATPIDCTGRYSFHFDQAYLSAHALAPGTTIYAQYVARDPGLAPPDNIGLSDAIRFTICP